MSPQKINEAVAWKLGWVYFREDAYDWGWKKDGERKINNEDYCTDLKAAWEIVEFITTKGYWLTLKQRLLPTNYEAFFDRNGLPGFEAYADTAPMAICLAFLKLP